MKKRKIMAKYLLVCFLLFLTTNYSQAAEQKSTESIQKKVLDIANGSDDIYGEGAPIDHEINMGDNESNTPKLQFISGGIDHTHQYIVASALTILNNDFGNSILNEENNTDILMSNTDWPDIFGNETDGGTFSGHFYDPDSEKNWLGQTSPTCKTRATSYFNKAVTAYNNGDVKNALIYLGRGTHYVSDVNVPHHASNLTAINSNHSVFEKYVDKNRKSYVIINNTLPESLYERAYSISVNDLIRDAARNAKALVPKIASSTTFNEAGDASVTNAITSVSQYIYKFGKTVEIY